MEHFEGTRGTGLLERLQDAFFFSAQTLTTVGNGRLHPLDALASAVAALESLTGLMGFALACGLVYGRFSRPHARILFSRQAVVAPFRGMNAFMFRIVNERSNQLIEVEAHVTVSLRDPETGFHTFSNLDLERTRINLFPSNWTIVHPIDPASPLTGLEPADLRLLDAEFIVLIKAFDDTFAQNVYSRTSYKADEIVWGRRFAPMTRPPGPDGMAEVDPGAAGRTGSGIRSQAWLDPPQERLHQRVPPDPAAALRPRRRARRSPGRRPAPPRSRHSRTAAAWRRGRGCGPG